MCLQMRWTDWIGGRVLNWEVKGRFMGVISMPRKPARSSSAHCDFCRGISSIHSFTHSFIHFCVQSFVPEHPIFEHVTVCSLGQPYHLTPQNTKSINKQINKWTLVIWSQCLAHAHENMTLKTISPYFIKTNSIRGGKGKGKQARFGIFRQCRLDCETQITLTHIYTPRCKQLESKVA